MTNELLHGRCHAKYQKIHIYDQFVQEVMSQKVKLFVQMHASMFKSGHPSKGQGYDFMVEEENKKVKSWLTQGVPSDKP